MGTPYVAQKLPELPKRSLRRCISAFFVSQNGFFGSQNCLRRPAKEAKQGCQRASFASSKSPNENAKEPISHFLRCPPPSAKSLFHSNKTATTWVSISYNKTYRKSPQTRQNAPFCLQNNFSCKTSPPWRVAHMKKSVAPAYRFPSFDQLQKAWHAAEKERD